MPGADDHEHKGRKTGNNRPQGPATYLFVCLSVGWLVGWTVMSCRRGGRQQEERQAGRQEQEQEKE